MNNKKTDIIWGVALLLVGVILILNLSGITNIDVFFKGWWTLFIIVPSIIGIIKEEDKAGSFVSLTVGVLLLLCSRGILSYKLFWQLLLPITLIIIGLSLIFKKKITDKVVTNKENDHLALFSGQKVTADKDEFKGTTLTAIFGAIDCDLRNIKIKNDIVINSTAIFGGIDIIVPDDIKVVIKSTSIFGGSENKKVNKKEDSKYTIYVNCNCIFGGVEIK